MDKNIAIMDELMSAIVQTDVWLTEQRNNPEILAADKRLEEALGIIKGVVPDNTMERILDATYSYAAAFENAAILYGIHVADAIHDVEARPSELSQHILARIRASA